MLGGELLFRTLSYFHEFEDQDVRRDTGEGISSFGPYAGLLINNLTQGTTFTMPNTRFEAAVKQSEIYIFCAARYHSTEKVAGFSAVASVEVMNIREMCQRIKAALPQDATFYGKPVAYYDEGLPPGARWALPEIISTSKVTSYSWQASIA